jgi:uncharacterized protein (DUF488 family)
MKKVTYESKSLLTVFTIGHSTHTLEEFIKIIEKFKIEEIVDVRTIPRSRHNPQFNKETLPTSLLSAGIGYMHIAGLGGLRHTKVDSPNKGWSNASFRGYADYMQTSDFEESLNTLIGMVKKEQVAVMCAESLPWRCHRSLIADALLVRGFKVEHIMNKGKSLKHTLTPWIKVDGTKITYPTASNKKE